MARSPQACARIILVVATRRGVGAGDVIDEEWLKPRLSNEDERAVGIEYGMHHGWWTRSNEKSGLTLSLVGLAQC